MEQKIKGGTIVGLVADEKPENADAPKADPKPKRTRKPKNNGEE